MERQVAIIGAGMAGLSAALALKDAGIPVAIYEKSRALGGRVATRRVGDSIIDHGAQVIKPDGTNLANLMMDRLSTEGLVQITGDVRLYDDTGNLLEPDPEYASHRMFSYRSGVTSLPKMLVSSLLVGGVQIFRETKITAMEEFSSSVLLRNEEWDEAGRADAVIVTAPTPQASELFSASHMQDITVSRQRAELLRSLYYKPCLSVLLGYSGGLPEPPCYAVMPENRERPLLWLAFEHLKSPSRAPVGHQVLVAQLGPEVSRDLYASEGEEILQLVLESLGFLFADTYSRPDWCQVKRWRYALPAGHIPFEEANPVGQDSRIFVAGDGLMPGGGRVQDAYECGQLAAVRVMELFERESQ